MPDEDHTSAKPAATPIGLFDKSGSSRFTPIELTALVMTLIWLALTGLAFLVFEPRGAFAELGGALHFTVVLIAILMPVALIWAVATAARSFRLMQQDNHRLQVAVDALRHAYITQNQGHSAMNDSSLAKKLDEIKALQHKTDAALAALTPMGPPPAQSLADPAKAAPQDDDQVDLPLGTQAEDTRPPLARDDFIRALNFPENPEDKVGFATLRRALSDRPTALLIRAAQDILTLISQDGVYMDDLRPDMPRCEVWRRFANGERGQSVSALGGVRDRTSLALIAARMRGDPVFRDAAHHFLRLFDQMITEFAKTASDAEISELANTRTARAFMLLGRVTGTFN
jgi:hypothetical protein